MLIFDESLTNVEKLKKWKDYIKYLPNNHQPLSDTKHQVIYTDDYGEKSIYTYLPDVCTHLQKTCSDDVIFQHVYKHVARKADSNIRYFEKFFTFKIQDTYFSYLIVYWGNTFNTFGSEHLPNGDTSVLEFESFWDGRINQQINQFIFDYEKKHGEHRLQLLTKTNKKDTIEKVT